jgi:hypothetical protein
VGLLSDICLAPAPLTCSPQPRLLCCSAPHRSSLPSPLCLQTYNYGVDSYDIGEGFGHFAVAAPDVAKLVEAVKAKGGSRGVGEGEARRVGGCYARMAGLPCVWMASPLSSMPLSLSYHACTSPCCPLGCRRQGVS